MLINSGRFVKLCGKKKKTILKTVNNSSASVVGALVYSFTNTHIMPTVNKKQKRYPWQSAPKPFEQMKDRAWSQALYNSWRWRKMAKVEIVQEPYCVMCYEHGIVTTENLQRDHVDGFTNEYEFWNGRRQTLCKWHNMNKAQRKGAEVTNNKPTKQSDGGGG